MQCNVRMGLERRMRWAAHVACVGWKGDPHSVSVEKIEGKSHLGRPMRRLYCIKMNCKESWMDSYGQGCRSLRDYRDLSDDSCYGMCARRLLAAPYRPAAHLPVPFQGQAVQEQVDCLTLEDGTDRSSRNVSNYYQPAPRTVTQESLNYTVVEPRNSMPSGSSELHRSTGLFISPSGISELDCATTKKDTAERSISIGRESLQVFFLY